MKVLFLIRTLAIGGAERQLVNLAIGLKGKGHEITIVTFYPQGVLQKELVAAGVQVSCLEKRHRWDIFHFFLSLIKIINNIKPQVIHGYGITPNIFAVLSRLFNPNIPVVFGVRASFMDLNKLGKGVKLAYRLECFLSRFADKIITNSKQGKQHAIENGFPENKLHVIFNGINAGKFKPNDNARSTLRKIWKIEKKTWVIGFVGRLDLMKDHPTFLASIAKLEEHIQNFKVICIGSGSSHYENELIEQCKQLGIENDVIWLGARGDVADCMSAFDLLVSSSYGEGFPNVIAEGMACGVPCVVTDVGDSAFLVDNTGIVAKPKDSTGLALAIERLIYRLKTNKEEFSHQARSRIINNFTIEHLVANTERSLNNLIKNHENNKA